MSKVAEKVADSLYQKDYISEEEKEIYSYGYEILIDNIGKTFLLLMVGAIIHQLVATLIFATVYKGNIIKNLIMDCQSYTKYRPNETTGGIFVSWRRKEELPTGA